VRFGSDAGSSAVVSIAEQQAGYEQPVEAVSPSSASAPVGPEPDAAAEPEAVWMPLVLALMGMAATTAGMVYFAWVAWDYRARYREAVEQQFSRERRAV
jgi:hypothetical protein